MDKWMGNIIYYSNTEAFIESLPKRNDFIDINNTKLINNGIKENMPVIFLPNDILEQHYRDGYVLKYKLILFGILKDGSKAAVVLSGIRPFFDVRAPIRSNSDDFISNLRNIFKINQFYPVELEILYKYSFKYFQEKESLFIRVYFNTLHARNKALNFILDYDFEYYDSNNQKNKVILETASNDKSCYYRKVAREYKFKLCDWNLIQNYSIDLNETYCKKKCVRYTFLVNIGDIKDDANSNFIDIKKLPKPINIHADPKKYVDLIRDKSMICVWDIETDALHPTGDAPQPDNVFSEHDVEEDVIRMLSMVFYWYWDSNFLIRVNFTDMICPSRPDCLIVICQNQVEIIKAKALLLERMVPEFYSGFLDSFYDWPFVIGVAEAYDKIKNIDLINFMKQHMSIIIWSSENAQYAITGRKSEHVKIEADIYTDNTFFDVPGFICIDTCTIFRQLYPTSEKYSLNYFLSLNKLGSKEDMPYNTMFKIFRVLRKLNIFLRDKYPTNRVILFEDIVNELMSLKQQFGENHKPLTKYANNDSIIYNVTDLTINDILVLIKQATDVVHYCNIDSQRCQELLRIRSIISDRREMANLSYTSMYDACYRAGGMKVRNLVIAEGIESNWNIVFNNIANSNKDKR